MSVLKEINKVDDNLKNLLEVNYGIKIDSDINNNLIIRGESEKNINKAKKIIQRENFLKENLQNVPNFKPKEGSVSSKLRDYEINDKKNYKMMTTHKSIKIVI